jgi:hypothetical protein
MQVRAKASVVDTFGVETLIYSQPSNTVIGILTLKYIGALLKVIL